MFPRLQYLAVKELGYSFREYRVMGLAELVEQIAIWTEVNGGGGKEPGADEDGVVF